MIIKQKKFSGFSILEMILAIGIFVIMLAGSASITNLSGVAGHMALEHDKAVAYLTESIEAVRNIKRVDWENITNGVYGLDSSDGTFKFDGSSDSFEKYTRTITVEDAYRDGDGNISDSGDFDEDIKKITVNVSWDINPYKTKNVEKTFYLADWSLPIINGGNSGMLVYADYSAEDDKLKYRILSQLKIEIDDITYIELSEVLRSYAADYLVNNLLAFLRIDRPRPEYEKNGVWGDNLTLFAISEFFNISFKK